MIVGVWEEEIVASENGGISRWSEGRRRRWVLAGKSLAGKNGGVTSDCGWLPKVRRKKWWSNRKVSSENGFLPKVAGEDGFLPEKVSPEKVSPEKMTGWPE